MKKGDKVVIDFSCFNRKFWYSCGYDKDSVGIIASIVRSAKGVRIEVNWSNGCNSSAFEEDFKPYEDKNASLPNLKFRRRSNG